MIIGFSGRMGSGKSTAVEHLLEARRGIGPGVPIAVRFAADLYKAARAWYEALGMPFQKETARMLLQFGGTEWGRGQHGESFWVERWKQEAGSRVKLFRNVVLVEDVRFDNEAEAIKALGGVVIEVRTTQKAMKGRKVATNGVKGHSSENGVSKHLVDAVITNSGSEKQFKAAVEKLYDEVTSSG